MNAINSVQSSSPASSAEPSMEDILASIRRIIADDQALPEDRDASGREPGDRDDAFAPVGETPSDAHAPAEKPDAFTSPQHADDLRHDQDAVMVPQFASPEAPLGMMAKPHPLAPPAPTAGDGVASHAAGVPHRNAPELLAPEPSEPDVHEAALRAMHEDTPSTVVDLEPQMTAQDDAALFSAATSQSLASAFNTLAVSRLADDSAELRGLAREMLKPLLKEWLDAHLPAVVESMIRDEIERMSRRPR